MSLKYSLLSIFIFSFLIFLINNFFLQVDYFLQNNDQTSFLFYECPNNEHDSNYEEENLPPEPVQKVPERIFLLKSFFGETLLLVIYFFASLWLTRLSCFWTRLFFDDFNQKFLCWCHEDYKKAINQLSNSVVNRLSDDIKNDTQQFVDQHTALINNQKYYFPPDDWTLKKELMTFAQKNSIALIIKIMAFLAYFIPEAYFLLGSGYQIGFQETKRRFQWTDLFAFYDCFYFRLNWFPLYVLFLIGSFYVIRFKYNAQFPAEKFTELIKSSPFYCNNLDSLAQK